MDFLIRFALLNPALQLPPLPQYITLKGSYFHSEVGLGIKSITLFEFDASKMQEAGEVIHSRIAKIMDVSGYTPLWTFGPMLRMPLKWLE